MKLAGTVNVSSVDDPNPPAPPGTTIVVDGCEIDGASDPASKLGIYLSQSSLFPPVTATITNSYFHGGQLGVYVQLPAASSPGQLSLTVVNDTFEGLDTALAVETATTLAYSNDIFTGSKTGVRIEPLVTSVTHSHNALFANTTNYAGVATDGAGYVKQDCSLTNVGGVPQPSAASACHGGGDSATAPPTDYWNVPRGTSPDIGAVQVP